MKKDDTKKKEIDAVLIPVEAEVRNLLDMFEYFLSERQLEKPIEKLGESVHDMRLIIGRILVDHFLGLSTKDEERFCSALAAMLVDRTANVLSDESSEQNYHEYCIGEILTSFEYAQEIKEAYSDDPVLQKILALDIPILRPFDYGLQGKLKVIEPKKKRRYHG